MTADDPGLAHFNAMPLGPAEEALRRCCASDVWITTMAAGRPYADRAALLAWGVREVSGLDWVEVQQALSAQPASASGSAEAAPGASEVAAPGGGVGGGGGVGPGGGDVRAAARRQLARGVERRLIELLDR